MSYNNITIQRITIFNSKINHVTQYTMTLILKDKSQ